MVEFNGKGWTLGEENWPFLLKIADEKKRLNDLIDKRSGFAYITVEGDKDRIKAKRIKAISKNLDLYIGVDDIFSNSKEYYKNAELYKDYFCTFKNIYDNAVKCGTWITKDNDIPAELGKGRVYLIDCEDRTLDVVCTLVTKNTKNIYIDVRGYGGTYTNIEKEAWMFDSTKVSFDVSVVLSLYKRPDLLNNQIEMLKRQTLKPIYTYLFQDGIDENYKIVFNRDFFNFFDDYKVCSSNQGVWGRFDFAKKIVKTNFVCIYDDDTISGERWLENCHVNMQFRRGIYGTNGILMERIANDYPYSGWTNVGWHRTNIKTYEVDLVGHSWFMESKCLEYMFENNGVIRGFKHVGEDMWLSYSSLLHGLHTFVPPHPIRYCELWGSIPSIGLKYGTNNYAVSSSFAQLNNMKMALEVIQQEGWKLLCERNELMVKQIISELSEVDEKKQILQQLANFCENEAVFVYGAGRISKRICAYLKKNDYIVEGLIVTDLNGIKELKSIPLFSVSDMKGKNVKVILGLGERYHHTVRKAIKECNDKILCFPEEKATFSYEAFINAMEEQLD